MNKLVDGILLIIMGVAILILTVLYAGKSTAKNRDYYTKDEVESLIDLKINEYDRLHNYASDMQSFDSLTTGIEPWILEALLTKDSMFVNHLYFNDTATMKKYMRAWKKE